MCGQPMHRLHYGPVSTSTLAPRFVGRGERHATPHTYRPVLVALRCVEKCSPASGGARLLRLTTPSSLRSFAPAPPCRAASSSPHIAVINPLALINPRRGRAVACECIKIHPADFHTHASHLTAHRGRSSAYSARSGAVGARASGRAVGGVQSHYGGKPP